MKPPPLNPGEISSSRPAPSKCHWRAAKPSPGPPPHGRPPSRSPMNAALSAIRSTPIAMWSNLYPIFATHPVVPVAAIPCQYQRGLDVSRKARSDGTLAPFRGAQRREPPPRRRADEESLQRGTTSTDGARMATAARLEAAVGFLSTRLSGAALELSEQFAQACRTPRSEGTSSDSARRCGEGP